MDYLVQSRYINKKMNTIKQIMSFSLKILFVLSIMLLIASVCAPFIFKMINPYVAAASFPLLFASFILVLVYNLRSIDNRMRKDDITRKLCFEGLLKKSIIEVSGSCSDDIKNLLIIKFQRRIDNLQKKAG